MRKEVRIFRLDRFRSLKITNEPFAIPADFNGALYGEEYNFIYREPYEAVVSFDVPLDIKIFGMDMAQLNNCTYKIRFQSSGKFLSELLSLGTNFKVLHPLWLRERLLNRLHKVFSANRNDEKTEE